MKLDDIALDVNQSIEVNAAVGDVFRGVLRRFHEGFATPKGESLQMRLNNGRAV